MQRARRFWSLFSIHHEVNLTEMSYNFAKELLLAFFTVKIKYISNINLHFVDGFKAQPNAN